MSQNQLPNGWNENRVRKLLAHYDEQLQDDALAEDEAGVAATETVMNVPAKLSYGEIVEGMRMLRLRVKPGKMSIRDMIDEGRRF